MKRKILLAAIPLMVSSALIASEEYGDAVPCPTSSYVPIPISSLSTEAWEEDKKKACEKACEAAPLSTEELARRALGELASRALESKKKIEECSLQPLSPLMDFIYSSRGFREAILTMWKSIQPLGRKADPLLANPCIYFLQPFYEIRAIESTVTKEPCTFMPDTHTSTQTRSYLLTDINRFLEVVENQNSSGEHTFQAALELCEKLTPTREGLMSLQKSPNEERLALAQKQIAWVLASGWSELLQQAETRLLYNFSSQGRSFELRSRKTNDPLDYCEGLIREVELENLMSRIEPLIGDIFTSLTEAE